MGLGGGGGGGGGWLAGEQTAAGVACAGGESGLGVGGVLLCCMWAGVGGGVCVVGFCAGGERGVGVCGVGVMCGELGR